MNNSPTTPEITICGVVGDLITSVLFSRYKICRRQRLCQRHPANCDKAIFAVEAILALGMPRESSVFDALYASLKQ
jgi:hypothetical protein